MELIQEYLHLLQPHFLLSHNADKCLQRQVIIQTMPKYLTKATGIDERGSSMAKVHSIGAKCDYWSKQMISSVTRWNVEWY